MLNSLSSASACRFVPSLRLRSATPSAPGHRGSDFPREGRSSSVLLTLRHPGNLDNFNLQSDKELPLVMVFSTGKVHPGLKGKKTKTDLANSTVSRKEISVTFCRICLLQTLSLYRCSHVVCRSTQERTHEKMNKYICALSIHTSGHRHAYAWVCMRPRPALLHVGLQHHPPIH